MEFTISYQQSLDKLQKELSVSCGQALRQANQKALQATLKTLKKETQLALAKKYRAPLKAFSKRIKVKCQQQSGVLWVGLNPVDVTKLGKPQQLSTGVKVNQRVYPSSFIAVMPNYKQGAFKRVGKRRLPIQNVKQDLTGDKYLIQGVVNRKILEVYNEALQRSYREALVLTNKNILVN